MPPLPAWPGAPAASGRGGGTGVPLAYRMSFTDDLLTRMVGSIARLNG
jgi:hypothetical protein